jgi:hypothetical protein
VTVLSVTGAQFDVRVRRGAALGPYTVTATRKSTGLAISLTGATISCHVRKAYEDPVIVATVVCTITNATAGQFSVELDADTTAAITAGDYVWDLIIEESSGKVTPWWRGTFTVTGRATL